MKNRIDLASIVSDNEKLYNEMKAQQFCKKAPIAERPNSPDFVDSSDVPPLD